jgi:hypothetical protein
MLQVVSNVGVVIGLVLVAIQMQQTGEAIRASRLDVWNQGGLQIALANVGDNAAEAFATSISRPAELTDTQLTQLMAFYDAYLSIATAQWQAYQSGQISPED